MDLLLAIDLVITVLCYGFILSYWKALKINDDGKVGNTDRAVSLLFAILWPFAMYFYIMDTVEHKKYYGFRLF